MVNSEQVAIASTSECVVSAVLTRSRQLALSYILKGIVLLVAIFT